MGRGLGQRQEGDENAETRLVELFSRPVRVMVRVRGSRRLDEEDLTQEVLMTAISAIRRGQLRDADRLGAFVAGIARNVINNRLRTAAELGISRMGLYKKLHKYGLMAAK